jgi:hypothetical protein
MTILKDEHGRKIDEAGNLLPPHAPRGPRPEVTKDVATIQKRQHMLNIAHAPRVRIERPTKESVATPRRPPMRATDEWRDGVLELLTEIRDELRTNKCGKC